MAFLRCSALFAVVATLVACGCGDDDDSPLDGSVPEDATPDGDPTTYDSGVDSGIPCERDEECDDEVDCTVDRCDPASLTCSIQPNDELCRNDQFCDGDERCSPTEGCVPGPSRSCSDGDVCTIDECDEAIDDCLHRGRDFDRDGHADWHCEGGDDCNDNDSRIYGGAPEICADLVDNDCNGLTEAEEPCTSPGYDTCDDPLDVTGGGAFDLSLAGTVRDYMPSCGFGATNDAVLTFWLDEEQDVEITVESDFVLTTAALQTECGAELTEVDCNWGFPANIRARAVPPGEYFVIVQADGDAEVLVVVELSDPTPAPTNETCDGAIDVSAGGRWEGSFIDVDNDHPVSCGYNYPDLVYEFTIAEVSDVIVTATSGFNYIPMSVSTTCGNQGTEIRCSYAAPSRQRLYSLDPGRYYVIVEGSDEFDFTLDVDFLPPSEPPEGDVCDTAIDISEGGVIEGTLVDRQDDVETSCGFAPADTVYTFTIDSPKDVTLEVLGGGGQWMTVALQATCGDRMSEPQNGCRSGNPAWMRVRDLPAGTYFVVVEAFPTDFTLELAITDPVAPTDVVESDTCGGAFESPLEGGVFQGDTSDAADDYSAACWQGADGPDEAIFLNLLADARVIATLDPANFNGVLHVHDGSCIGGDDELSCIDWGAGDIRVFESDLPPGPYYFVVDGARPNDFGAYVLDLTVLLDN